MFFDDYEIDEALKETIKEKDKDEYYSSKIVWQDSDDENITVSLKNQSKIRKLRETEEEDLISGAQYEMRLRNQFEKLNPTPNWATLPSKISSDKNKKIKLFHPNAQVLMTAGLDKTIRLFQIDGKINPKIQSTMFKDLPIFNAAFNPSGEDIVVTGRKKHYYIYNIESDVIERPRDIHGFKDKSLENFSISPCGKYIAFAGKNGYIALISYKTKQWITSLKVNGLVKSIDWSSNGQYLFSLSSDAEIYQWDVGMRKCIYRFLDYGGFKPTRISISKNDCYYSIGSNTGVVNIYDKSCLTIKEPKPLKSFMNLTTCIHDMKFNHDTQILGISNTTFLDDVLSVETDFTRKLNLLKASLKKKNNSNKPESTT
ncbi:23490_t:CDS:2 [Entrophospora sp. SA101]|nr:10996_t:CDS:2 [Entrophospora sp. SA101]CAJ0637342.1 11001_t:CDS:2 [Entrophospora sp. SA101]CAJ0764939.1 23490_t:CDS:2 [Entrophospora sp. SA101]CAJ0845339.1 7359_t:CDS:2 [Entrophospora sp. SA101]